MLHVRERKRLFVAFSFIVKECWSGLKDKPLMKLEKTRNFFPKKEEMNYV
jgi:hypothetical protein